MFSSYKLITFVTLWISLFTPFTSAFTRKQLQNASKKSSNHIISVDGPNFQQVLDGPREDSYILLLLTATSPAVQCGNCLTFEPYFNNMVQSWFNDHPDGATKDGSKHLFFAKGNVVDTSNIPAVFSAYEVTHVPRLMLLGPNGGYKDYTPLVVEDGGKDQALQTIEDIQNIMQINEFVYHQPIDWASIIITSVSLFIITILIKKYHSLLFKVLAFRFLWAVGTVAFIVLMICGFMYNKIRNPQLAGVSEDGGIRYFLEGEQSAQFAIETQVMSVLYGLLGIFVVALVLGIPKMKKLYNTPEEAKKAQGVIAIVLAVGVYMIFTGYTNIFRMKMFSYPYALRSILNLFG